MTKVSHNVAPVGDFAPPTSPDRLEGARQVLKMEAEAILSLIARVGDSFELAVEILLSCSGKVVVTGMGKSGHIAGKIAATFASTGTPAFFVHPAELRHGDFGMLDRKDVVVALSGSGETQEIKLVLDPIKRLGLSLIAITGNTASTLATFSDAVLDVGVSMEACPLNLAPTSSTTAALAMGDALAMVLMTRKGFRAEDFARSHPGGNLGRQLVTVQDLMRSGIEIPRVSLDATCAETVGEIDKKNLGFSCVINGDGSLAGIITDGDIRRAIFRHGQSVFQMRAAGLMTAAPKTISASSLAVEALKLMETHSISDLLILGDQNRPEGVIHLKDLLKAGIV